MVISNAFGRVLGLGGRWAALFGVSVAMVAPACGGRSIRTEEDGDSPTVPTDDDGSYGGGSSSGGAVSGVGGGSSSGGAVSGVGGGTPAGGTSPCGGGGFPPRNSDPECKGIFSNMQCAIQGKQCADLVCGLADSGRRQCNCASTWSCSACDYSNSPFRDRPAVIPACSGEVADEVPCTEQNAMCGPVGSEYCAWYFSCMDGLLWDCDSPPSTWR